MFEYEEFQNRHVYKPRRKVLVGVDTSPILFPAEIYAIEQSAMECLKRPCQGVCMYIFSDWQVCSTKRAKESYLFEQ